MQERRWEAVRCWRFGVAKHKERKESQLRETDHCALKFSKPCALPAPPTFSQDQDRTTLAPLGVWLPSPRWGVSLYQSVFLNAPYEVHTAVLDLLLDLSKLLEVRDCAVSPLYPRAYLTVAQAQRSSINICEVCERMLTECGLKTV